MGVETVDSVLARRVRQEEDVERFPAAPAARNGLLETTAAS